VWYPKVYASTPAQLQTHKHSETLNTGLWIHACLSWISNPMGSSIKDVRSRGGAVGHQSDGHKIYFCVSGVRIEVRHPPPLPSTGIRIAIYFTFRRFYARCGPDVRGLPNGQCWKGRRGVSKKSVFAKTSLMETFWSETFYVLNICPLKLVVTISLN